MAEKTQPKIIDLKANRQAVTSYDVARLAGVSQSAVSRCFKPGASVSAKMRARVMAAAAELGYEPNAIARSLITRRSNLVAFFKFCHMVGGKFRRRNDTVNAVWPYLLECRVSISFTLQRK